MKIVHIITSLDDGGAEHTLYKICKYDKSSEHIVISLKGAGKYFYLLNKICVKVYCLNLKFYAIYRFLYFIKLLRSLEPDVVQTWLVHADLIGGLAARFAGIENVVWNIRYSNFNIRKAKLETILLVNLLVKLSYFVPKLIIINSKKAKKFYEAKGYNKKKLVLIQNGYDLSILKPNKFQEIFFKKKFKIEKTIPVIGNVARYDPKKDHSNLLKALSLIKSKNINFLCVLVGARIDSSNVNLISEIKKFQLSAHVKLLGQNSNISEVMNGLDIYIQSSSYGEGFPNVVAESMACGTPCIVTDVGDASDIVGKTGWTVPPNKSIKLAKTISIALNEIRDKKWSKRCSQARSRIKKKFYLEKMIKSYSETWNKIQKENKNLLFDLNATQPQNAIEKKHGGSEYTKVIFKSLVKSADKKNITIDAVYNPKVELDKNIYEDCKKYHINLLPISHKKDIENVLKKNNYKKFFSGLGYGLRNVDIPKKTKFLPVVHGLRPVEMPLDKYEKYYAIDLKQKIIIIIKHLFSNYYFEYRKKNYFIFIKKYVNSLIVVSNHTKNSIISFYPKLKANNIKTLYSPEKLSNRVTAKKTNLRYILMISASVWIKNSYRGILALDDFFDNKKFRGIKAVILGGLPDKIFNKIRNKKNFEIHDYVSTKQLEEYYANAYLFFYPTLNEGFGYPPLEAMKYGTPVIASSISAVREVCEHSVLYFNPYSIEEMTTRLIQFQSIDYKRQKQKAIKQYSKIKKKQIKDLEKITKLILS